MGVANVSAFYVKDDSGIQAANAPPLLSENITTSATSAQSSVMPDGTEVIRIATNTTIRVAFGVDPTATSSDVRLLADTIEYFTIKEGYKIAVIDE